MGSVEGEPPPQAESGKETTKPFYCQAARFRDERSAVRAYWRTHELLLTTECDLSTFRFQIQRAPYVAVLGVKPSEDLHRRLRNILSAGLPASLPQSIIDRLRERRLKATGVGPWVEGHYEPGIQVEGSGNQTGGSRSEHDPGDAATPS